MKRPNTTSQDSNSDVDLRYDMTCEMMRRCPHLHTFLVDTTWDDGEPRETGTVLIFCDGGRVKACLNDRALDRSVFVTGTTLWGLLDALEEGLEHNALEWRSKGGSGGKRRKGS